MVDVKNKRIRVAAGDRVFYAINAAFLLLLFLVVLYPLAYVLSSSLSSPRSVATGRVIFLPVEFSLEGYAKVLTYKKVGTGYINSIVYTTAGTLLAIFLTCLCAYPLSRKNLVWGKWLTLVFIFPMYFSGGMIPSYLLIQELGLYNTRAAVILPLALSVFNFLVARTFFANSIPEELYEYAQTDGCSDIRFFVSIVLPLSTTIIAVLTLYYAINYWNNYLVAFMYLSKAELYPLQVVLREILFIAQASTEIEGGGIRSAAEIESQANMYELVKYCVIVVSSLPLVCLYPLIQKYFVKGVMVGSVKG